MYYNKQEMKMIQKGQASFVTILLLCIALLSGCLESPYYQKQAGIPQNLWNYKYMPSFEFEVTDTTCLYDVYFLVRHTNAYPFSNIWMNIHTQQPGDTTSSKQRVNVLLAASSGINSGQWLGRGMGEIYEHKMRITHEGDSAILSRKGKYIFRFEQNMRINPLPEILQVGLRVERGKPRNFRPQ
jgi:gliding motility-associated lipoprotein GldH